jgi:hypothetical protein
MVNLKSYKKYIGKFSIFEGTPNIVNIDQHLALKKYILFLVITFAAIGAKAQSGYNYQEFGIGAGASYIRGYTNIARQYNHPAFNVNFIYNYNPYVPIEAEVQVGQLSGGGTTVNLDPYGRQYFNNYKALIIHGDFQLGAGIDYSNNWFLQIVKDFYIGTGAGLISNTVKAQRTNVLPQNGPLTYVFPGHDNSLDLMLPLRAGYEFKIYDSYNEPSVAIDIGYIHTFVFNEGLDGYDDPPSKFKNNAPDQYRQITFMVKYYFGNVTSYNKLIREFK